MKKILRSLLIIVIVIGFIFGMATIIKFIKLNSIYKKLDKNLEYDSFYLKTSLVTSNHSNDSTTETYFRNGTSKLVASNGVYTWTNGERAYLIDEANLTAYTLSLKENVTLASYNMFATPVQGYNGSFIDRLLLAGDPNTTIKNEKINDNSYYCIKSKENLAIKTIWVEKETGKIKQAKIEFSNGDVFDYEYELYFNSVKAVDVGLPDITGYKLINGETGNVLSENFKE